MYKTTKGLIYMSDSIKKYTVIREYKNEYSLEEFITNIIQIHINSIYYDIGKLKECSNHEVTENEKQ